MSRVTQDALESLIKSGCRAAFDDSLWPGFLERLADVLRGSNSALLVCNVSTGRNYTVACVRTDPELLRLYNQHYHARNPWIQPGCLELPTRIVGVGEMYCPEAELTKTDFYNEWLRPQGLKHSIAALVRNTGGDLIMHSTLRPAAAGPFGEKELSFCEALMPHVGAAISTRERVQDLCDAGRTALDLLYRSERACILLASDTRIVYANLAGEDALARGDCVRKAGASLAASTPQATSELHRLVAQAFGKLPAPGQMVITGNSGRRALIFVDPIVSPDVAISRSRPCAAVWVIEEKPRVPGVRRLQNLFGLTSAEAALAAEIARGKTLLEVAERSRLSRHTVRNQLKSVFAKTGARSQADLVRLVLGCPDFDRNTSD